MKFKKVIVTALTAAMVLANAAPAMAATWTDGKGVINKDPADVICVEVPTSAAFDFDIDGSGLLTGSKYTGNKHLYFTNKDSDGTVTGYSNNSDPVKIVNKSSVEVDVVFTGKITLGDADKSAISDKAPDGTEDKPSIYIAFQKYEVDGSNVLASSGPAVAMDDTGKTLTLELADDKAEYIKSAPEEADADGIKQWTQALKADPEGSAPAYFALTGAASATRAANPDESPAVTALNWKDVSKSPKVEVTYKITKHGDATNELTNQPLVAGPSIPTSTATLVSGRALDITVNPGAGTSAATGVKSIVSSTGVTIPTARYTYANNKISLDATFATNNTNTIGSGNTMVYTVTFACADDTDRTATFTLSVD